MSKKIWRPFNTWGFVVIGMLTASVIAYVFTIL